MMDANIIFELYENNKMFNGKKIKFYKDAKEIKKHKYNEMMLQSENILFGIKKNFEFHIMTDKAFYYTYSDQNAPSFSGAVNSKASAVR